MSASIPGSTVGASLPPAMAGPQAQQQLPARIPPLPNLPGLIPPGLRPTGMRLGSEQALMMLRKVPRDIIQRDEDQDLPAQLRGYAAGLRPAVRPPGAQWQQEIIYEKLGKSDDEIEEIARYYFRIAQNYDMYLSRDRITASQYYAGRPFGNEDPGRSQLVMTVVRDTIRATLPSLLRIFTGVEDPVSFEPVSADITGNDQLATALSRQATDYARWALFTANPGWQILHDALLDALTRKAGWIRWSWGKKQSIRTEVCEGLLLPQLQLLLSEPGTETQRLVRRPMSQDELQALAKIPAGQMYLSQGGPQEYWSATITRCAAQAWPIVESVPTECVWVNADAPTVQQARGIFHVRDVAATELIEAGLPEDKVLQHAETMMRPQQRREVIARDPASGMNIKPGPPGDRSMALVRYAEGWIRVDADNDHRAELLHIHCLGNSTTLIQWERCDEIPLSCFVPYREPGRIIGSSQADMVQDLQRIESRVMRGVLDSLGQSMFPRTTVVLGQANLADVRQTAIGSIIRMAQPNAVSELVRPFMGKEALPVLEVLESIRESRTGITRVSSGLTIDELQSTTPLAVAQQSSNAQDRLDMMARTLAETGLAPLYVGLLKMLARQQDRPNVIRLRGQWIAIDPRALATMWECQVNVGGRGTPEQRMMMLMQIAAKQESIMMSQGLNNPLVTPVEYRNTLSRLLETASIGDVSSYFKELPPGFTAPPPQQAPDPNLILAQVQQNKTSADVENDRAKAQTDRAKILQDDDLQRDQAALDAWTKLAVAAMQTGQPLPPFGLFKQAMASAAPAVGMLQDLPPANSPQPPAMSAPQQPPGGPPRPPGMPGAPGAAGPPRPPAGPPQGMPGPGGGPPPGAMDPATALAVKGAMMGRGPPSAYGQIANRALASAIAGPGGPALPPPRQMPPQQPPTPASPGGT
jgi:hypothetical protein